MANRVDSGKGSVPRSDSKVLGEKRVSVELGGEDELGPRKRIKMRDLESVCRAEGISKKQSSGQFQLNDEEMSEITEVPVTSDLDASRAGKAVRSTFPIAVNPIPKSLDLNNDACIAKNRVQNGSQECSKSSEKTTLRRDQVTEMHKNSDLDSSRVGKSVRNTIPAAVNPIPKPLNLKTDVCIADSTIQNGSQQCSKEKTTSPRDQVTEVPKTSDLDASRVGLSARSTIPVVANPIPKPLDLNTDACIGSSMVQNGSQQCSQSSEKTTLPRDQVTEVPKTSDLYASQAGTSMRSTIPVVVSPIPRPLDLNTDSCIASNTVQNTSQQCSQNLEKSTVLRDHDKECHTNHGNAKGNALDLNGKGVSSSENQDPFYPYKNLNYLKSRDVSECGSSTGPLEEKDPMTVWKEMKQNGFLSSTHGGISKPKQPVAIPTPKQQSGGMPISKQHGSIPMSKQHGGIPMPKPRPKKNKSEEQKKKLERAKKEQVDRFAKIAAPSGLLNELNPGIINHVRNRKQVHSIIEALVRSERLEVSRVENKQTIHQQSGTVENRQDLENMRESWRPNTFFEDMQAQGYTILMNKPSLVQVDNSIEGDPTAKESFGGISFASHSALVSEEETLALKLSSSNIAPEEDTPLSSKEETTSYLSFKAATVASQWLELIQQDIQGRLSALQRSRKRVRNVISTDLPLLLKKEFSSDKENDSSITKSSVDGLSSRACAEMHRARWGPRFDQMDKALSEEEDQLESWLNQVREMQVHCNKGLQLINCSSGIQALGTSETDTRSHMMDSSQREVAVRAAAASIYATCNFILSANASPCC
ncbi:hypothetical protein RchiOBHm_Chr1g0372301 [Rosa chinensis]|uniref:Uncharacterized protein n=1 Tax=Rosa chinensis TaxID=74649 RepID=A0A2P6SLT2_ROSCH|nr:uncharacterized protein LOC112186621 [Rosa chinensis]PRQ59629.1 hypothetical protein RchiOBHm_Chr1g0372301 [Rosa chinensis]